MSVVTTELCDQKHGELKSALAHIGNKMDAALEILRGNGKPGLRETQAEVARLKVDFERSCEAMRREVAASAARRDSWLMFVLRPLLPVLYGIILAGVLFYIK